MRKIIVTFILGLMSIVSAFCQTEANMEYYECYLRDMIGSKYEVMILDDKGDIKNNDTVDVSFNAEGKPKYKFEHKVINTNYPLIAARKYVNSLGYSLVNNEYQYITRNRWAEWFNWFPFTHVCWARDISFLVYKNK